MTSSTVQNNKVFVAMSGGVDSSVAAALLAEQGFDVEGVTMCLELPPATDKDSPSCCGVQSIEDARRVCKKFGIAHHVLNYGEAFEQTVIKDFVNEYAQGRTPNPCVNCNRYLKFDRLFRDAHSLGATHLSTGHYAIIENGANGWVLKKGVDPRKDQSYFLYGIPRSLLANVLFPLGALTKAEVREHARRLELPVAEKRESQDICFVPEGRYQDFLRSRGQLIDQPGPFIDHTGKVVGEHGGVAHYTVGQREGLGIALGYPAYVNRIDTATNTVFVGPSDKLFCVGLEADGLNLVSMNFSKESFKAGLKIRYNHSDIQGTVELMGGGRIRVLFREPHRAVTPGQSVVFYNGDVLLGGGIITHGLETAQG